MKTTFALIISMWCVTTVHAQVVSVTDKARMVELRRQLDRPINQSRFDVLAQQYASQKGSTLPEVQVFRKFLEEAKNAKNAVSISAAATALREIFEDVTRQERAALIEKEILIDENIHKQMEEIIARYNVGIRGEIWKQKRKITLLEKRAALTTAHLTDYAKQAEDNVFIQANNDQVISALHAKMFNAVTLAEALQARTEIKDILAKRKGIEAARLLEEDVAQAKADMPAALAELQRLEALRLEEEKVAAIEAAAIAAQEQAELLRGIADKLGVP